MRPVNSEVLAIKAAQQIKLGLTNYWSTWRVLILLFPIVSQINLRLIARFIPDAPTARVAKIHTQLAQRASAPPKKSTKSVAIWLTRSTWRVGLTRDFALFLKNYTIKQGLSPPVDEAWRFDTIFKLFSEGPSCKYLDCRRNLKLVFYPLCYLRR